MEVIPDYRTGDRAEVIVLRAGDGSGGCEKYNREKKSCTSQDWNYA